MLGDFFFTDTPVCLTSAGRLGRARFTRFCTCTWASSRLVPNSNVTVRVYTPSLELRDDMYRNFLDTSDLLLDGGGDRFGYDLGVGSGIDAGDFDRWRRDLRILGDRQGSEGDRPDQHNNDRDDGGEDRPVDEKLGYSGHAKSLSAG